MPFKIQFSFAFLILGICFFFCCFSYSAKAIGNSIDSSKTNKLHYKLSSIFEDDNYLLSLKNVIPLKDGNDYGYTYALNLNGMITKNKNSYFFKYHKSLYTQRLNDSIGNTLIAVNSKTNQKLKLVHIINIERFLIGYEHDDKFIYKASIGLEHRGRLNQGSFSATNIQSLHHKYILRIAGFYYCKPDGEVESNNNIVRPKYAKEILKDEISPISILSDFSIGKNKFYKKNNLKINAELGYFLSTEKSNFIGQNSNLFAHFEATKYWGRKSNFSTQILQNLKYYANCNTTNINVGYVQTIGMSYRKITKKMIFTPSLLFFKPFGRIDFYAFNDNDINISIKLDIEF
ncbi:MAG: hypothetical protein RL708_371 [Bacteroidota bacterium]|jgi:hypothetical protein